MKKYSYLVYLLFFMLFNMRKKILLLFLIISNLSFAQNVDFQKLQKHYISLTDQSVIKKDTFFFKNITIVDARYDTSLLGFIENNFLQKIYKISFHKTLSEEIKDYLKSAYFIPQQKDTTSNILVVLRKLWLTNAIAASKNSNVNETNWSAGVNFKAELFIERNGVYKTLYKIDSSITTDLSDLCNVFAIFENQHFEQMKD